MRLFYLSEPFEGALGYDWRRKRLWVAGDVQPDTDPAAHLRLEATRDRDPRRALYFAAPYEWTMLARELVRRQRSRTLHVLSAESTAKVLAGPGMPLNLGPLPESGEPAGLLRERVDALRPGGALRIAVLNISHLAFGDAVLSLTFLRELYRELTAMFRHVELDLFQRPYIPDVERLYARCGFVHATRDVPAPLTELREYDAYFDLSVPRRQYDTLPWIDTRLRGVGLDPATIPAERKRNRLTFDPAVTRELGPAVAAARAVGSPLLLFHGQASTGIRSLPAERVEPLLDALLDGTDWTIVTLAPLAFRHPRVIDWSPLPRSFDHFISLIASVDAFVSVDTSLYHIADAFDVPGVVMFTSNLPEQWIGYYPFIAGVALQRGNQLLGTHDSEDPDDVSYARALWRHLDVARVRATLDAAVARARAVGCQTAASDAT